MKDTIDNKKKMVIDYLGITRDSGDGTIIQTELLLNNLLMH